MLVSIDRRLEEHRAIKEYPAFTDAVPDIIGIIAIRKKTGHTVKILAASSATTANTLLVRLASIDALDRSSIDVTIAIVDPDSSIVGLPNHWPGEVRLFVKRLKDGAFGLPITCYQYQHLPCLRGVLIDDEHLFLGCHIWNQRSELAGADQPHIYIRRETRFHYLFQLWESWFKYSQQKKAFSTPSAKPSASLLGI